MGARQPECQPIAPEKIRAPLRRNRHCPTERSHRCFPATPGTWPAPRARTTGGATDRFPERIADSRATRVCSAARPGTEPSTKLFAELFESAADVGVKLAPLLREAKRLRAALAIVLGGATAFAGSAFAKTDARANPQSPRVPTPAVLAELGRAIFFDTNLSEPRGTSCASCHDPERAFTGNNHSTNGRPRGSRPGTLRAPRLPFPALPALRADIPLLRRRRRRRSPGGAVRRVLLGRPRRLDPRARAAAAARTPTR